MILNIMTLLEIIDDQDQPNILCSIIELVTIKINLLLKYLIESNTSCDETCEQKE